MSNDVGTPTPDEILMAAYQAGNEAAFGELFERYAGSVYGFLVRRLGDRSAAEDLYQEAFLRLHRARQTYDSARPFRAWLFGIVHNLVTDALRSRGRVPETTSLDERREGVLEKGSGAVDVGRDEQSPERIVAARQSSMALSRALSSLPSDEATVLILARIEGLPYDDIAAVLGRSAAATKQLAYRALKRVRAKMIADGHEEEP
jgi:RNA polymerase sigma-70 factor, ECF subfamily